MHIAALHPAQLVEAMGVLAVACPYDRASDVAAEKLFAAGPHGQPQAYGAWEADRLIGVAAVAQQWVRIIAVVPQARRAGVGSALLATCEAAAEAVGHTRVRMLDEPGNYLAPGIDDRNADAIEWLCRRGWRRDGESRCNAVIAVRDNPRVTPARVAERTARLRENGYEIRRAARDETPLVDAIRMAFGGAWPFEVQRALGDGFPGAVSGTASPGVVSGSEAPGAAVSFVESPGAAVPAVHVAVANGAYCAFAAHDGNNRGLGWFGPAGTWPEHRGRGLGEVLLLSCLLDVARDHDHCEVAWVGPRAFYDKVAGIIAERHFVALVKDLPPSST